jgi:hypothetical protein
MKSRGLLFAAALIVGTNAIVLLGVARNQAGPPLVTIQLTERELPREPHGKEDSGVSLRLQWQRFGSAYLDQYAWMDRTKLEELGFDCQAALRDPKHLPLERPAFLALEYDGPAWEQWQKAMEKEPKVVHSYDSTMESRLFVVDGAKQPEPLFERYKDRKLYIVVRGVVRVSVVNRDPVTRRPGPDRLQASVSRLLPESIHVPMSLAGALQNLATDTIPASPRYTVTLSYGRRFEPWIVTKP